MKLKKMLKKGERILDDYVAYSEPVLGIIPARNWFLFTTTQNRQFTCKMGIENFAKNGGKEWAECEFCEIEEGRHSPFN